MELSTSIVVVDDNDDIRVLLKDFLIQHNYHVIAAANGNELLTLLQNEKNCDLIILDVMLPDIDGITLCQQIRREYTIPIIMLTAVNTDADRIISLELGADDYLAKPFNPRELLARIRAVLRRSKEYKLENTDKNNAQKHPIYEFNGWNLDVATQRLVSPEQAEVPLSAASYNLLLAFIENPQQVLTRDQLLIKTKNRMAEPYDRSIDVHISRLRQKIENDPKKPKIFKTVQSAGYMFTPAVKKLI